MFETRCRELFLAVSFEKRRFFRRRRFLLVGTLCHHRENKARWQQRERELETYRFYSPCVALLLFNSFAKIAFIFIKRRQRKQCMSTAEDPSECKDVREDYLECLHHKKEFQRANAIQAEADRQRGEEATKIWAKIEKHVNDTSWGEVKKEGEGEKAS